MMQVDSRNAKRHFPKNLLRRLEGREPENQESRAQKESIARMFLLHYRSFNQQKLIILLSETIHSAGKTSEQAHSRQWGRSLIEQKKQNKKWRGACKPDFVRGGPRGPAP
jgi:hypothetical protein